jgi:hypothetical protein
MVTKVNVAPNQKALSWLYFIIYAIIIIIVIVIIVKIYNGVKTGINEVGNIAQQQAIKSQTGIDIPRQSVCNEVATQCRDAMTKIPLTDSIIYINEDAVVTALNKLMTAQEAILTSDLFKQNTGFSLKSKVVDQSWIGANFSDRIKSEIFYNLK